jgi:glycosyltransferase involved in cell wall biosynthesis
VVIHNGMPDVPTHLRANPGMGDEVRAVMVARFAPPKDHATLLRAMPGLPDLRLDLVGDGPDLDAARRLAAELGINDRVRFLRARADVAEILAASHLFVLSSHSEGFPLSTLEAMRAGLPVVVTDAGGAPEAVVPGETGFVVACNNVDEMRGALARLAADAALRARFGASGRRRYKERFAFDRMYERTLATYEEVLAARAHPHREPASIAPRSQHGEAHGD